MVKTLRSFSKIPLKLTAEFNETEMFFAFDNTEVRY